MAGQPKVKVRFEVEGEGEVKKGLRNIDKDAGAAADAVSKRFSQLGRDLAALGIGTAIGAALGYAIRQTIETERVTAQLEARLKSTGGVAGVTKSQLLDMADGLQSVTTFGDNAILEMQTLLLTFTQIRGPVVKDATQAILDISVAMGTDLKSSAIQVGKALNDPIKGVSALAEVGVSFTEKQKDVIKALVETGDVAGAQAIILQELSVEFGGAARAARDTFGGALEALKATIADMVEGEPGTLDGAKNAVEELNKTLGSPETKAAFNSLSSLIAGLTSDALTGVSAFINYIAKLHEIQEFRTGGSPTELSKTSLDEELGRVGQKIRDLKASGRTTTGRRGVANAGPSLAALEALREQLVREKTARIALEALGENPNIAPGRGHSVAGPKARALAALAAQPEEKAKAGKGSGGRSEAEREREKAAREALRALREQDEATQDYQRTLEDLRAEIGGPLAKVELDYIRREDELIALAAKGKIGNEELAEALALLESQRQKEIKAINDQLTPTEQLISDMEFELSLMGKTNAERQTAIDLRRLDGAATAEQAEKIRGLNEAFQAQAELVDDMDFFRDSVGDLAKTILTDFDNAGDAVDSFFDKLLDRLLDKLINDAMDSLFGKKGTTDTGSSGGFLSSLFGGGGSGSSSSGDGFFSTLLSGLFGGGRASGGPVSSNRIYEVGEGGRPEIYQSGGRSYLIPGNDGNVSRLGDGGGGGGMNVQVHHHYSGPVTRQTRQQMDADTQRSVARARRTSR